MIEIINYFFMTLTAAGALFAMAQLFFLPFFEKDTIPQEEIDAEARFLIVTYGEDAIEAAKGNVTRSQWAKGRNDSRERSERVLKAVRASLK